MEEAMTNIASFARMAVVAVGVLSLTSCAGMNDTQQRMVSGGATGAVVGTVGTVLTGGCVPCGTAIGAAVGTGAGYVMDYMDKQTKPSASASATP
jgi:osmotically inducible lipoprotein OsmB